MNDPKLPIIQKTNNSAEDCDQKSLPKYAGDTAFSGENAYFDVVEKEFVKHGGDPNILRKSGQAVEELEKYLNKQKISTKRFCITNKFNSNEHTKLSSKMVKLMLIEHFKQSNSPVIVHIFNHWMTVMGLDPQNNDALLIDSASSTGTKPVLASDDLWVHQDHNNQKNLDSLCNTIAIATNKSHTQEAEIIFTHFDKNNTYNNFSTEQLDQRCLSLSTWQQFKNFALKYVPQDAPMPVIETITNEYLLPIPN